MNKNIVFIGMMGSWKTTVGRLLAKKLDREFIDIDNIVEKESGYTVVELFNKFGEDHFRIMETEILRSVLKKNNCIISTGGGTILSEVNRKLLIEYGTCFLLRATTESLAGRIRNTSKRPILDGKKNKEEILSELWEKRKNLYEETADHIIDTDDLGPDIIVDRINEYLRMH